ncbi:hypothetical protein mRhiFer1_009660 [Rhinolophus ferrumequinum]|uniref:Uncharacterized protein n=1 Tax=Rhinolophus ferrumequinum TaxID=59479 RepID=A0A7J7R5Z7_RHIFE|nr:hypothetical protein mRhiFer1_009660 [Rhinolophus ferrumequinum]
MFIIKLLASGNHLEMETGGNHDARAGAPVGRTQASARLGVKPPQGPALQSRGHQRSGLAAGPSDGQRQGSHQAHSPHGAPESSPPAVPIATALLAPWWPLLSSCTRSCWQVQCRVYPPSQWGEGQAHGSSAPSPQGLPGATRCPPLLL